MSVSVVISVYNVRLYIERCLHILLGIVLGNYVQFESNRTKYSK